MRQHYQNKLMELQSEVSAMGAAAERAIAKAVQALKAQDLPLAQEVVDGDDWFDEKERTIEEACMSLIALEQPLAGDLRAVGAILKIVTDLERMGDHAVNIAEATLAIGSEPLFKPLEDMSRLAQLARGMANRSLDAFLKRDEPLARKTIGQDPEVDALYAYLVEELTGLVGREDVPVGQAFQLLLVARSLERIADHATNIAERAIYLVSGERVPHQLG